MLTYDYRPGMSKLCQDVIKKQQLMPHWMADSLGKAFQWPCMAAQGAIAMTSTLPPREAQEYFGILVWTFAILMHPEYILESPIEVTCFEFNTAQPSLVVGGCCNGQIIMWDHSRVSFGAPQSLYPREKCTDQELTLVSATAAFTRSYGHTCGTQIFCMASNSAPEAGEVSSHQKLPGMRRRRMLRARGVAQPWPASPESVNPSACHP